MSSILVGGSRPRVFACGRRTAAGGGRERRPHAGRFAGFHGLKHRGVCVLGPMRRLAFSSHGKPGLYREGRNVQIDYRWAGGDPDKAQTFARELIAMMPDVMVPSTNQVTRILQQETRTIPIVFAFVGDPVGSGLAASLARPGKNITGFANFENSIGGK